MEQQVAIRSIIPDAFCRIFSHEYFNYMQEEILDQVFRSDVSLLNLNHLLQRHFDGRLNTAAFLLIYLD